MEINSMDICQLNIVVSKALLKGELKSKSQRQYHYLLHLDAPSTLGHLHPSGGADILQFENSGTSTTDVSSTQVSCPYCNKMLSSRSLSRHIDNVHRKSKPHLCKKCLQRFAMKHHLQNHVLKSEKNGFCARIRPRS